MKEEELFVRVPLTNGGFALVDIEDYELVKDKTWRRRDEPHTSYAYNVSGIPVKEQKAGERRFIYTYMHRACTKAENNRKRKPKDYP